jgi:hypothetical protein
MWNLLKRNNRECSRLRDALEEAVTKRAAARSVTQVAEQLTAEERKHLEVCGDCREAMQDLVATKELFQGALRFGEEEKPWFAARVMAAIATRERELARRVSAWTEFPRSASRLAWVMAVVLLAGTTWFYERVVRAPKYDYSGGQESLFEVPQQTSSDDILISMAGDNP